MQLLVQVLVISCLDNCNSLLAGFPASVTNLLKGNQNAAACLIFSLPKFSHLSPLLRDLHWLPVAASKHWSDHMPKRKHFAPLHQLAGWYHHHWEQTKLAQQSRNSSLFWRLSGGTNSQPMAGQQSHLPSSTKDSRLTSPQHRIAWLPPTFPLQWTCWSVSWLPDSSRRSLFVFSLCMTNETLHYWIPEFLRNVFDTDFVCMW